MGNQDTCSWALAVDSRGGDLAGGKHENGKREEKKEEEGKHCFVEDTVLSRLARQEVFSYLIIMCKLDNSGNASMPIDRWTCFEAV